MAGSFNNMIDHISCIPHVVFLQPRYYRVKHLNAFFQSKPSTLGPGKFGMASGTDTSLIASLTETDILFSKLIRYRGQRKKKTWYGVTDENQLSFVVLDLKKYFLKEWSITQWYVSVVQDGVRRNGEI